MSGNTWLDRVHSVLWSEFDARPGSISATQQQLGVCENFLRTSRARQSLKTKDLLEILAVLDIPPAVFFARVFPSSSGDLLECFGAEAAAIEARDGANETVTSIRERFADPLVNAVSVPAEEDEAERLEALRQRDPRAAVAEAEAVAAGTSSPTMAVRAMAVWMSSLRVLRAFDDAVAVLWPALQLAERLGDRRLVAELASRASYIAGDRGEHTRGVALADWAVVLFSELGDRAGVGKAHYDRGVMLVWSGAYRRARRAYRSALAYLPESMKRFRAGALQGLSHCCQELGDLEQAATHLQASVAYLDDEHRGSKARVLWMRARLAVAREALVEAEDLYCRALELMTDLAVDAVLVAAERVRVLMLLGREAEARRFAVSMTGLVFEVEHDPVAEAAVARLILAARSTSIPFTLGLVDALVERIGRGRLQGKRPRP